MNGRRPLRSNARRRLLGRGVGGAPAADGGTWHEVTALHASTKISTSDADPEGVLDLLLTLHPSHRGARGIRGCRPMVCARARVTHIVGKDCDDVTYQLLPVLIPPFALVLVACEPQRACLLASRTFEPVDYTVALQHLDEGPMKPGRTLANDVKQRRAIGDRPGSFRITSPRGPKNDLRRSGRKPFFRVCRRGQQIECDCHQPHDKRLDIRQ
jgi:hypothetical protein